MKGETIKSGDLSLLVVGAGAVGGITAALLKKKDYNVEIVCKNDDYASLIMNVGLEVKGAAGDFKVRMPAYSSVNQIKERKDLVLLATKATDMIEAARSILPILKENGYVVFLQNGFCEEDLASIVGINRVVRCVVGWGATMELPGKLFMSSKGDFILGYPDRIPDEFLESLAEIMSAVVPVRTSDNIMGHLYSKLIINSCITSLGVISGMFLGKMLSIKKARKIFIEIIREAIDVTDAMKIRVDVFGGKLNFYRFLGGNGLPGRFKRHLLLMIIGFKYRKLKSSSLQSLAKSKPTEIDYLNGYIVRKGQALRVHVPVNTAVVNMVHEIENGSRKISENNFNDPIFDRFN
jgi:2-dehydropantoate 2-reductase